MKGILGLMFAVGLVLGGALRAEAAPAAAGLSPISAVGREAGGALVTEVGYRHRGHYRRVAYGRPHYAVRRGYYRPVYDRPVRYRPVYVRPTYVRPVYGYGYGYGPRCTWRWRPVYTWAGWVNERVRVCRW